METLMSKLSKWWKSKEKDQNNSNYSEQLEDDRKFILHPIEDTPFTVVEKNDEYIIVVGKQKATSKTFQSLKEATDYIKFKNWDLIINAAIIINEGIKQSKQSEQ